MKFIFFLVASASSFNFLCSGALASNFSNRYKESNTVEIANNTGEQWMLHDWEEDVLQSRAKRETNNSAESGILKQNETENATSSAELEIAKKRLEMLTTFKSQWPVERWLQYGLFTDDYLNLINDHWLQFPPPSETLQKTLGGFYLLFATVGCWGNIIVLFMYFK